MQRKETLLSDFYLMADLSVGSDPINFFAHFLHLETQVPSADGPLLYSITIIMIRREVFQLTLQASEGNGRINNIVILVIISNFINTSTGSKGGLVVTTSALCHLLQFEKLLTVLFFFFYRDFHSCDDVAVEEDTGGLDEDVLLDTHRDPYACPAWVSNSNFASIPNSHKVLNLFIKLVVSNVGMFRRTSFMVRCYKSELII